MNQFPSLSSFVSKKNSNSNFELRFGHVAVNCKVFFSRGINRGILLIGYYILVVILWPILSPLTFGQVAVNCKVFFFSWGHSKTMWTR